MLKVRLKLLKWKDNLKDVRWKVLLFSKDIIKRNKELKKKKKKLKI